MPFEYKRAAEVRTIARGCATAGLGGVQRLYGSWRACYSVNASSQQACAFHPASGGPVSLPRFLRGLQRRITMKSIRWAVFGTCFACVFFFAPVPGHAQDAATPFSDP